MSERWPNGAKEILDALDDTVAYSRAVLMMKASLTSQNVWRRAMEFLVRNGLASQVGTKRLAVYKRQRKSPRQVSRSVQGYVVPEAAEAHHKVLDEVLRELHGNQVAGEIDEKRDATSVPARALISSDGTICWRANDAVCERLASLGVERIIDRRTLGGALWVVDSPEVAAKIEVVTRELGVVFHFCMTGARATSGYPGWWTKDWRK
jgi:hypothetical protein